MPRKSPKDWSPTGKGPKKKFIVSVKEVHVQKVAIDATSEEEAIKKVAEGEGEQVGDAYYVYTKNPDHWTADEDR